MFHEKRLSSGFGFVNLRMTFCGFPWLRGAACASAAAGRTACAAAAFAFLSLSDQVKYGAGCRKSDERCRKNGCCHFFLPANNRFSVSGFRKRAYKNPARISSAVTVPAENPLPVTRLPNWKMISETA